MGTSAEGPLGRLLPGESASGAGTVLSRRLSVLCAMSLSGTAMRSGQSDLHRAAQLHGRLFLEWKVPGSWRAALMDAAPAEAGPLCPGLCSRRAQLRFDRQLCTLPGALCGGGLASREA